MSTPALSTITWSPGFDGVDILSPRAEVAAELARVEAAVAHPDSEWMRQSEVEALRLLLLRATDKGGF